nr:malto-oligosyltrehalose trehalohydrolase [Kineobactrum salinum]
MTELAIEYTTPQGDLRSAPMDAASDGWFHARIDECGAGSLYRFVLDNGMRVPDPASRYQPDGVHGPSEVIVPGSFAWRDGHWRGRPWEEAVIYELHPGCFSPEAGYRGVIQRLDHLLELGVTALELMPVSQAPGRRNWGYDGSYPYAPSCIYGRPEDLKHLAQAAHERGLMVLLDVVYNHFGPEGNYLHAYAPDFFTDRYHTPWGQAINLDGAGSGTVREFFIHNALYWLTEYHLDGLRLDAVHALHDSSAPDFLEELASRVRALTGSERHVHLVLENDHNAAHYLQSGHDVRPGYDAQWNDDMHHCMHLLLTGESNGYYQDYADNSLRRLGRCLAEGFAYQGEYSPYRRSCRGEASNHLPPSAFVAFMQNHDQIGNRACGDRLSVLAPAAPRQALTSILLLAPSPPLLFMGEEWATRRPFLYFCDFDHELAEAVRDGRREEFSHFPEFAAGDTSQQIPDPNAPATYQASCLDWSELTQPDHQHWLAYYQQLLALRHQHLLPVLAALNRGTARVLADDRYLQVEWRSGAMRWSLLANLADAAIEVDADGLTPDQPLFASNSLQPQGSRWLAPPWHTSWYLHCADHGEPARDIPMAKRETGNGDSTHE